MVDVKSFDSCPQILNIQCRHQRKGNSFIDFLSGAVFFLPRLDISQCKPDFLSDLQFQAENHILYPKCWYQTHAMIRLFENLLCTNCSRCFSPTNAFAFTRKSITPNVAECEIWSRRLLELIFSLSVAFWLTKNTDVSLVCVFVLFCVCVCVKKTYGTTILFYVWKV